MLLWLLSCAALYSVLLKYESKGQDNASKTPQKIQNSDLGLKESEQFNLVMFVHPKCPCTMASLTELQKLKTRLPKLKITIAFMTPDGMEKSDWLKTTNWQKAHEMTGIEFIEDYDGKLAKKFGAEVSGYTIVYNAKNELVYAGGITAGRGHEGDNEGEDKIIAVCNSKFVSSPKAPAFGCGLIDDPNPNKVLKTCL